MASPPTTLTRQRVRSSDSSRGWLSHGLAALAISVLGLAFAGSVTLTTSAQPPAASEVTALPVTALPVTAKPSPSAPSTTTTTDPSVAAFARRGEQATGRTSRSAAVRAAVLHERSAQRDEALAKTDEQITRAALAAKTRARQQNLSAAEQAQQTAAAALAAANRQRAAAAAAAATIARQQAETSSTSTAPSADPAPVPVTGGGSASPVPGAVVGAHFGQYGLWSRYHTGLDFRASHGTPIKAVKSGVVLFAGNSGNWAGNYVAIRHADGKTTMSSHMSSMAVRADENVQAGQVIGYVGQTGRAFGAHLHFEVYPAGVTYGDVYQAINPAPWLGANGVQTR